MNVPTPASAPYSSAFWPIVARHVRPDRRAGRNLAYGLMVLSMALRLALVPATGNTNDLLTMIGFGAQVASHGPTRCMTRQITRAFTRTSSTRRSFPSCLARRTAYGA